MSELEADAERPAGESGAEPAPADPFVPAFAVMPAGLRARVVAMAAEALGTVPPADVPPPLRAVAKFVPAKRARAGGTSVAAALESDPVFRQHVAAWARSRHDVLIGPLSQPMASTQRFKAGRVARGDRQPASA